MGCEVVIRDMSVARWKRLAEWLGLSMEGVLALTGAELLNLTAQKLNEDARRERHRRATRALGHRPI